jgi:hypothetical protein
MRFVFMYENKTMNPVEIVLKKGMMGDKGK